MRIFLFLVSVSILIFSCDSNRIAEDNKDIDNYWKGDSIAHFNFKIEDSTIDYNVFFSVRNGVEFPHSNLYFKYVLKDSIGKTLESELVNFQLFNAKTGYPLGNGVGDIFEHQYELLTKYKFITSGTYQVSFQQYMRYDSLPEIYSVGFRVEKTINQQDTD